MWYLKFKCRHTDCIYAPKLQELGLAVFFYHLGYYAKGNHVYTSAIQHLVGKTESIRKYVRYMRNHKRIVRVEDYGNVIFTLAKHGRELEVYMDAYSPILIHPSPAYLSRDGFEIVEVACWDRKPLEELIRAIEENKTTTHFEILKFVDRKMDDVYVSRLLPQLSPKQEEAIKLAFGQGYYKFPRRTTLGKLAKIAGVSKPTFRENLRRAESKIIPNLVPG